MRTSSLPAPAPRGSIAVIAAARLRRGFTLIEVLVTFTIAALLMTLAGPSLYQMIQRKRAVANAEEILTIFQATQQVAKNRNYVTFLNFRKMSTQTCYASWESAVNLNNCRCGRTPLCDYNFVDTKFVIGQKTFDAASGVTLQPVDAAGNPIDEFVMLLEAHYGYPQDPYGIYKTDAGVIVTTQGGGQLKVTMTKGGVIGMCSIGGVHRPYPTC